MGRRKEQKEGRLWYTTVGRGRRSRLVFDIHQRFLEIAREVPLCEAMTVKEKPQIDIESRGKDAKDLRAVGEGVL